MDSHIRKARFELLQKWFDDDNAEIVLEWLVASENRRPVVVVGSGFSRNAWNKRRNGYASAEDVPLWADLAKAMATDLGLDSPAGYDPVVLAELYLESLGKARFRQMLEGSLADDDLVPYNSHYALARYDHEAVITTNCLDTLLDKAFRDFSLQQVVVDEDLSATVDVEDGMRTTELLYFHGHRSRPDTWVLTRSQYEERAAKRPVITSRVRQLLAQRPLLLVGYSLNDPDFHDLYRQLGMEMKSYQPVGLAVQLTSPIPAEIVHWRSLGIRIAVPKKSNSFQNSPNESNEFFFDLFAYLKTRWRPDSEQAKDCVASPKTGQKWLRKIGIFSVPEETLAARSGDVEANVQAVYVRGKDGDFEGGGTTRRDGG